MLSGSTEAAIWEYGRCYLGVRTLLSQKLWDVLSAVHPHAHSCQQPQALHTFCALHSPKLRDASGSVHPMMKTADSLRLWAPPHAIRRQSRALRSSTTFYARLTQFHSFFFPEFHECLRDFDPCFFKFTNAAGSATARTVNSTTVSGSEHSVCIPLTKNAGRLKLCAPP